MKDTEDNEAKETNKRRDREREEKRRKAHDWKRNEMLEDVCSDNLEERREAGEEITFGRVKDAITKEVQEMNVDRKRR